MKYLLYASIAFSALATPLFAMEQTKETSQSQADPQAEAQAETIRNMSLDEFKAKVMEILALGEIEWHHQLELLLQPLDPIKHEEKIDYIARSLLTRLKDMTCPIYLLLLKGEILSIDSVKRLNQAINEKFEQELKGMAQRRAKRIAAEQRAKEATQRKAKEEDKRKAQLETEQKAKEEAERNAKEEAEAQADAQYRQQFEEARQRLQEAEAALMAHQAHMRLQEAQAALRRQEIIVAALAKKSPKK